MRREKTTRAASPIHLTSLTLMLFDERWNDSLLLPDGVLDRLMVGLGAELRVAGGIGEEDREKPGLHSPNCRIAIPSLLPQFEGPDDTGCGRLAWPCAALCDFRFRARLEQVVGGLVIARRPSTGPIRIGAVPGGTARPLEAFPRGNCRKRFQADSFTSPPTPYAFALDAQGSSQPTTERRREVGSSWAADHHDPSASRRRRAGEGWVVAVPPTPLAGVVADRLGSLGERVWPPPERDEREQRGDSRERDRVPGFDAVEQTGEGTAGERRCGEADQQTHGGETQSTRQNHAEDRVSLRPQSHNGAPFHACAAARSRR